MANIVDTPSVQRVRAALKKTRISSEIVALSETARTAQDAANSLGIEVGQVASSIVFKLFTDQPLLVITSGRHRVDAEMVAKSLSVGKLHRADADFVKAVSGFSIGGVSPVGWKNAPDITIIDEALNDYEVVWAAAGHPHAVFPTSFGELMSATNAIRMVVGS